MRCVGPVVQVAFGFLAPRGKCHEHEASQGKSFLVVGSSVAMWSHVRARVRHPPDAPVASTVDNKHTATTGNNTEVVIAAVAAAETTADAISRTPLEIDYYDLLGVSTGSTTAEIVSAYRRKAREVADLPTTDKLYVRIKKVSLKNQSLLCSVSCSLRIGANM